MARKLFKLFQSHSPVTSPPPRLSRFSDSATMEKFEAAASVITQWNDSATSLFRRGKSEEERLYVSSVKDLQSAMLYFVTEDPKSEVLERALRLMQTAMKRLEKEFRLILTSLDLQFVESESRQSSSARSSVSSFGFESDDDVNFNEDRSSFVTEQLFSADLKVIADCMIESGYGDECIRVFKSVRKSILDEEMVRIGMEKQPISYSQMKKMDWEVLDLKIETWLKTVKTAVKSVFYRERILSEQVFSTSIGIAESCFAAISTDSAIELFDFAARVSKLKKSPQKNLIIFIFLDMYEAIANLWPEIDSIFSSDPISPVRSRAVRSLINLGASVRALLSDFESSIQKTASKTAARGGGIHPWTRDVMNYLVSLGNYNAILADIFADSLLRLRSPLPESYTYFNVAEIDGSVSAAAASMFAWLVLGILSKIGVKAELIYREDAALSNMFIANNLQYVVVRVRESNLCHLLGKDWISKHELKVEQYAAMHASI